MYKIITCFLYQKINFLKEKKNQTEFNLFNDSWNYISESSDITNSTTYKYIENIYTKYIFLNPLLVSL